MDELSGMARRLFAMLLVGCVYCWLAIAATTDVAFITNSGVLPLPIIQTAIPLDRFYVFAPLVILCVFIYFLLYLQRLFDDAVRLRSTSDDRNAADQTDAWLLTNGLIWTHVGPPREQRLPWTRTQLVLSVFLAYALVPVTLFFFWGAYLRRQDWIGTGVHLAALGVSIGYGYAFYHTTRNTLLGRARRRRPLFTWLITAIVPALLVLSACAMYQPRDYFVPKVLGGVPLFRPWVNLTDSQVASKPSNWSDNDENAFAMVPRLRLAGLNLRNAIAVRAFMVGADLSEAELNGANLSWADLRDANLRMARFRKANLRNAKLCGGRGGVEMSYADFTEADLTDTTLVGDLFKAKFRGATLWGTKLTSKADRKDGCAAPRESNLEGADFREAVGLCPEQIREARNWEYAYYDEALRARLSLPEGHNEALKGKLEERHRTRAKPRSCAPPDNCSN